LIGQTANTQTLACNNLVYLSLDNNGEFQLTAEMILEGNYSEFDSLWVDKPFLTCDDVASNPIEITVFGRVEETGEIIQCWSEVIVEDKLPPIAIGETSITVDISNGPVFIDPLDVDDGSWDNCGIVSYTVEPSIIDCNTAPPFQVILTIEDQAGLTNFIMAELVIVGDVPSNGSGLLCAPDGPLNVINGPVELTLQDMIISGPTACLENYAFTKELHMDSV